MLKKFLFCLSAGMLFSCSGNTLEENHQDKVKTNTQQFTIVVESVGELFSGASEKQVTSRRPISSVTPEQTIDKLSFIIVRNDETTEVVYLKTIDGWCDTNNLASTPWRSEDSQGRLAVFELKGDECLENDRQYMIYAIGYQTGTYGGYEPFKDLKLGDSFLKTEVADVPEGGYADEIFAGAEVFNVHDGKIYSQVSSNAEEQEGMVILRRQVAGTFGYFTGIPVKIGGKSVAKLKLVATRRNQSVIFGGFRTVDDSNNFHKGNVINGMSPRSDYDSHLAGSDVKDAFLVYEVDLCKWFPGNTQSPNLPLDINRDGLLDYADVNWQINEEKYPDGSIKLPRGTVFGDCFWVPVSMTQDDIDEGKPTFQMQLVDENGVVLKYWDVLLRDLNEEQDKRTIVSLPDGRTGRAVITEVDNLETDNCYSIVRNRLYTMGSKAHAQGYGEDEPINLSTTDVLVLDSKHQWEAGGSIIF